MSSHDAAVQIWQVLIAKAHQRETIGPATLADLIGSSGKDLAQPLSDLQQWCASSGWPPITELVLGIATANGQSPSGTDDADADRQAVFGHAWFRLPPLTAAALGKAEHPAKRPCPRCGREGNALATLCGYCWLKLAPA